MRTNTKIAQEDYEALKRAKNLLETETFTEKASNLIGKPIEQAIDALPEKVKSNIEKVSTKALGGLVQISSMTLKTAPYKKSNEELHKFATAVSGFVSGFFGLAAFTAEIVTTTSLMFRSILEIAQSEGENVNDPKTQIAALEVFGMGSLNGENSPNNSSYYAFRSSLAKSVEEATKAIAKHGAKIFKEKNAPALIKLIAKIAERFGMQVSEKAALEFIPIIGAVGAAAVNYAFTDLFQKKARGHFIVRRLERKYGKETVEEIYKQITFEEYANAN